MVLTIYIIGLAVILLFLAGIKKKAHKHYRITLKETIKTKEKV